MIFDDTATIRYEINYVKDLLLKERKIYNINDAQLICSFYINFSLAHIRWYKQ